MQYPGFQLAPLDVHDPPVGFKHRFPFCILPFVDVAVPNSIVWLPYCSRDRDPSQDRIGLRAFHERVYRRIFVSERWKLGQDVMVDFDWEMGHDRSGRLNRNGDREPDSIRVSTKHPKLLCIPSHLRLQLIYALPNIIRLVRSYFCRRQPSSRITLRPPSIGPSALL